MGEARLDGGREGLWEGSRSGLEGGFEVGLSSVQR